MAMGSAMVVQGLSLFIKTIWGLQERRFAAIFHAVSSAAVSLTMALALCVLSAHGHTPTESTVSVIPFM